jgi:hypothetical protein
MPAATNLKDEINTLIKPLRQSRTKPPFSHEQLVVMAIVLSGDELSGDELSGGELSSRQIIEWEVATFQHYREILCAQFWRKYSSGLDNLPYMGSKHSAAREFMEEHHSALYSFDPPITEMKHGDKNESRWATTASAARVFLHDLIDC